MSNKRNTQSLLRYRIGEIPLLQRVSEQLGLETLLRRYLLSHGNEKVPAAETLVLLIYNITSGRQPLYELPQWTTQYDGRLFGRDCQLSETLFNDDRYGRALDKVHEADRASLMTDLVLRLIEVSELDLSQIHNDSTSVKPTGQMPGVSRDGLRFARGHSKDHRPDLKQIVFCLTLSSDGAVPIHFKTYSGNRTDDSLSARETLLAYKFQPRLEKRFQQLKSVHQVAPTLCKKVERVEVMMFLYFIALIIQALIERDVRHSMEQNTVEAIPIYPEHRLAYHPTTAKIVDRFQDVSVCRLMEGKTVISEFHDPLNPSQLSVLRLLGMSEKQYWKRVS